MALVTAGVPVYNGEAWLDEALASLSAQTYPDFRIEISDNASTDSTPAIIEKWAAKDPRISVIRQPANIGALPNYEFLLRRAKSPWFMFAAYDDLWSPDYVEKLHAAATRKPGCLLSVPLIVHTDMQGKELRRTFFPEDTDGLSRVSRVSRLLRAARGSWFYGLHDRAHLAEAWNVTHRYGHVWGMDLLVFLPALLADKTVGDNGVIHYARETGLSQDRYRPKTAGAETAHIAAFLRESLKSLDRAPLPLHEKAALVPALLRHAKHGGKLRRALRLALKGQAGGQAA